MTKKPVAASSVTEELMDKCSKTGKPLVESSLTRMNVYAEVTACEGSAAEVTPCEESAGGGTA